MEHAEFVVAEAPKKQPDFIDLLVDAITARVKDKLMEYIAITISENLPMVHADAIEGLEQFFDHCIEEHDRNCGRKVDADDVEGLDRYIKDTMKEVTIHLDF